MELEKEIFTIQTPQAFKNTALEVFRFQAKNCAVYKTFIAHLGTDPATVKTLKDIPFLPIQFFKNHKIYCGQEPEQALFLSSGTTGNNQSKHFVKDLSLYQKSHELGFKKAYGNINDYHIFALLPNYLERKGSSLIKMTQDWYDQSDQTYGGFYLYDFESLSSELKKAQNNSTKFILLIGVTFALVDFAQQFPGNYNRVTLLETGGMKGRKKELTRIELHKLLKKGFNPKAIHSEYGMTELLSQGYKKGKSPFYLPPWAKAMGRKLDDPLTLENEHKSAGLNIVDLANLYSCSFIATDDIVQIKDDGGFEVLGRIDQSDLRGCSLLASE